MATRKLAPGLTVHAVGGQFRRTSIRQGQDRRGLVVLASDVTHFYENMATQPPVYDGLTYRRNAGGL